MFRSLDTEILIRSLEDRIEKWERCADGSILAKPKRAHFDELAVTFRKVFLETEYSFIASINLVKEPTPKAKDEAQRILEKLGTLSFELMWKRTFLTKNPIFVTSTGPPKQDEVYRSNSEVVTLLNSEKRIMAKIQKLKPEEMSINLVPLGDLDLPNVVKERVGFSLFPDESPTQVSWLISLSKIMYRSVGYAGELQTIFDVLDHISRLLREISG